MFHHFHRPLFRAAVSRTGAIGGVRPDLWRSLSTSQPQRQRNSWELDAPLEPDEIQQIRASQAARRELKGAFWFLLKMTLPLVYAYAIGKGQGYESAALEAQQEYERQRDLAEAEQEQTRNDIVVQFQKLGRQVTVVQDV